MATFGAMHYQLRARTFQLQFRHAFHIAHGQRFHTDTVFTTIEVDGITGYGEAALPPYLGYAAEAVAAEINSLKIDAGDIDAALNLLHASSISRPAKASADIALHDLWAKQKELPLHSLLDLPSKAAYPCFYTLGISTIDDLEAKLLLSTNTAVYKIKLGGAHDIAFLQEFRKRSSAPFCADANQAWKSLKEASETIAQLSDLGCIFIEQPLPVGHPDLAALNRVSKLPIYLDESLQHEQDIHENASHCRGINIKLVKSGGIRPALQWIKAAQHHDLHILIGCMSESSAGAAAALQLSGYGDYVDLDGPLLISNDPFTGLTYEKGMLQVPQSAGLGINEIAGKI